MPRSTSMHFHMPAGSAVAHTRSARRLQQLTDKGTSAWQAAPRRPARAKARARRAQSSSAQSLTVQSRPSPPDAIMGSVGWQLTASTASQWPVPGASGPSRPSSTCTSCGARARAAVSRDGACKVRRDVARRRKARAARGAPAGCRGARCRRRGPPSRSPPTGPCARPPRTRQTPSAACSCGLRAPRGGRLSAWCAPACKCVPANPIP